MPGLICIVGDGIGKTQRADAVPPLIPLDIIFVIVGGVEGVSVHEDKAAFVLGAKDTFRC